VSRATSGTASSNGAVATAAEHTPSPEAIAWVEAFTEGWRAPRDADSFADHFDSWIAEDVRLVQPQLPTLIGREQFREEFARPLFELIDGLHATVESWAARGDVVLVEITLRGRIGGRELRLPVVDRVTLRDGLAAERVSYLDSTPLLKAVAASPSAWPTFLKAQASRIAGALREGG
jgi:ketosteroid isomerase-like protein